jgi:hypothetical protein
MSQKFFGVKVVCNDREVHTTMRRVIWDILQREIRKLDSTFLLFKLLEAIYLGTAPS